MFFILAFMMKRLIEMAPGAEGIVEKCHDVLLNAPDDVRQREFMMKVKLEFWSPRRNRFKRYSHIHLALLPGFPTCTHCTSLPYFVSPSCKF